MAVLNIGERQVTVMLDWWEKLAARRSHFNIPTRCIVGVSLVEDASLVAGREQRAKYSPGVFIKGLTNTGTFNAYDSSRVSTFAVCHGTGPGIVLELAEATVNRIVISTPQARDYAARLEQLLAAR